MLEAVDLTTGYGRIAVLHGVSLEIPERGIMAVLGANGAGKTTLARALSGLIPVWQGDIRLDGRSIKDWRTERYVKAGIIHVPQGRMLFPEMTVEENLEMGAYRAAARGFFAEQRRRVERYFPILAERRSQHAGVLSGGEQQMLAIGRALMASPRLLILDEPSLGLAPKIVREIFDVIAQINGEGVSVLVVEQNARQALRTATAACVLENGRVALAGESGALMQDEQVRRVYLGMAYR
jgi:branched-chain amino acid transport system ATP-binding protein